ncbi:MAG: PAS domain S-box protein, partial [Betaproteobacteria bacterium]
MSDEARSATTIDSSIPPYVPPDAADAEQSVFRTPWARRWAVVVLILMLVWTALAWEWTAHQYRLRIDHAVETATAQASSRQGLVEDGLRNGLAQLDGVAHMLTRLPTVRHAVTAAGPSAQTSMERTPELRSALQALPELAAMNDFLASSTEELGADLIYLRDDAGNCVASSDAGTATSIVGQHLSDRTFFEQTRDQHSARLFAVGRSTGIPGMYFSSAVYEDGQFIGAVFVKRNTRALAAMVAYEGAFVVDEMGVAIMSHDPRLLLHALPGGKAAALSAAERKSLYLAEQLAPLRIEPWDVDVAPALRRVGDDPVPQVLVQRHMERDGLDVYVAQPLPEVENLVRDRGANFALLALAGIGAIALVTAGLGGWRSRRNVLDAVERIGQANRMLSVEVAERQRAEIALRESREYLVVHEARLRALLRNLPEQVWMKDRAGNYLAVNAEFERFQGQPEGDVLGKSDAQLQPAERAEHYAQQDRATLAAAEPLVFLEAEKSAAGGGVRQLEITKTAVRDERGEVVGVVGIARDMTEIHAAHLALKTSEARFRATFETAGDAILIIRHALIVDCNRRAAEMLGAGTRDALLGQALSLFSPETQPDGESSSSLALRLVEDVKRGGMRTFEWRCRRLDDTQFDAEITISVFQHNGQSLLQAVLRDVSERRRMMAALESAKDEAERANRSKSVFLANMSHEIRTPL